MEKLFFNLGIPLRAHLISKFCQLKWPIKKGLIFPNEALATNAANQSSFSYVTFKFILAISDYSIGSGHK